MSGMITHLASSIIYEVYVSLDGFQKYITFLFNGNKVYESVKNYESINKIAKSKNFFCK